MQDNPSLVIAVLSLLVAIVSFMVGSEGNKTLRYGFGAVMLLVTLIFVFDALSNGNDGGTGTSKEILRFEVSANEPKARTGIQVTEGDVMDFEYLDGQWTWNENEPRLYRGCKSIWHDTYDNIWPWPPDEGGGYGALIGYIGNQPFLIGCDPVSIEAFTSGELYLNINDCQNCFEDNKGEIYVSISVESK